MTQVVAALIRQGDKFMIFQRPENKTRALNGNLSAERRKREKLSSRHSYASAARKSALR